MTGGEALSDGPHQQAEDRTSWTSHLPLEREGKDHSRGKSIFNICLKLNALEHKEGQPERVQGAMHSREEVLEWPRMWESFM